MSKATLSRLMLASAMAIFGTLAPFVRNIPVSSGELALYRAVMAIAVLGIFFLIRGKKPELPDAKKDVLLLVLSGFAMSFNWILLFEAYKYTTVAVATLSYYFAPVIVTAVCPFLFREKPTAKQLICFVMSTIGLCLVIGITDLGSGGNNYVGILFGLGAAALYATVILLNKFIKGVAGIERTFLQFLAAAIVMIPYVAATGGMTLNQLDSTGWICLAIVGVVHTGITYCMYFSSLKDIPGQAAAILSYIDPLVAVVISVLVLNEPLTTPQLIGGILVLGFTLLNEISIGGKKKDNT